MKITYVPASKLAEFRRTHKPDLCPIYGKPIENPVVDHDHADGFIRGVIDRDANQLEGKINGAWKRYGSTELPLPKVLRNLADYYERGVTHFLHPKGLTQLVSRFRRKKRDEQISILEGFRQSGKRITTEEILALPNAKQRAELYRKLMKK